MSLVDAVYFAGKCPGTGIGDPTVLLIAVEQKAQ